MEMNRVLSLMMSVIAAAFAALSLAYIAHYDFGLSREEIRTPAAGAAAVIAMLMAVEFFGKRLRKPSDRCEGVSVRGEDHVSQDQCHHCDKRRQRYVCVD
jgi:hypothetical protein